jgi:hypothetical protein
MILNHVPLSPIYSNLPVVSFSFGASVFYYGLALLCFLGIFTEALIRILSCNLVWRENKLDLGYRNNSIEFMHITVISEVLPLPRV